MEKIMEKKTTAEKQKEKEEKRIKNELLSSLREKIIDAYKAYLEKNPEVKKAPGYIKALSIVDKEIEKINKRSLKDQIYYQNCFRKKIKN
jgi:peroxiredoxin